jgi:hypothetical protein
MTSPITKRLSLGMAVLTLLMAAAPSFADDRHDRDRDRHRHHPRPHATYSPGYVYAPPPVYYQPPPPPPVAPSLNFIIPLRFR